MIAADALHHHAVHPTPLYESLGLLILVFIIWHRFPRRRFQGELLLLYPGLYGAVRFTVEFFRGDTTHYILGLRLSQFISLVLVIATLAVYGSVRFFLRNRPQEGVEKKVEKGVDLTAP